MHLYKNRIFFLAVCFLISGIGFSQDTAVHRLDTVIAPKDTTKKMIPADSIPKVATPMSSVNITDSVLKAHSPRKAAIRSAIVPGLGQIYNKKYWKVPIIYGALGISGAVLAYNLTNYRALRVAYRAKYTATVPRQDPITGAPLPPDSSEWSQIRPDLVPIDMNALRSYRDEFRRNIDYSVLAIMVLWGLNVVDATVDAHLKPFDVSPDLSLKLKLGPGQSPGRMGVGLVLAFHTANRQSTLGNGRNF